MCNEKLGGCFIIPPHMLESMAEKGNAAQKKTAFETLELSAQMRGAREAIGPAIMAISIGALSLGPGVKRRTIFDAKKGTALPGLRVRSEGGAASSDVSVNEAYDGSGATYDFYNKVFNRDSIDANGLRLDSTIHYGIKYNNAFWNGSQMVYGDGDGLTFQRFTKSIDVIGHELTHGVTQYEAGLVYRDQSGALSEHFSDVFGSLVKQYSLKQAASKADWLIGAGLFTGKVKGVALRSMKAPGTAYNDPVIGKDPQPAHMKNFVNTSSDNGGVHYNSGIPNKAFYELAIALGGNAWEKAGRIWYQTLCEKLGPNSQFKDCAEQTNVVAGNIYGDNSVEQKAVKKAWTSVGL
jgi:Zn-dependent metalloprotease